MTCVPSPRCSIHRDDTQVNIEACRITTVSIAALTSSPRLKYLVAAVSPRPRGSRSTESVQNRQLIYGLKSFASIYSPPPPPRAPTPAIWKLCVVHIHLPMRAENKELLQAASPALNPHFPTGTMLITRCSSLLRMMSEFNKQSGNHAKMITAIYH